MKRLLFAGLAAALVLVVHAADKITWHSQLKAGLKAAASSGKPVLLVTLWKAGT